MSVNSNLNFQNAPSVPLVYQVYSSLQGVCSHQGGLHNFINSLVIMWRYDVIYSFCEQYNNVTMNSSNLLLICNLQQAQTATWHSPLLRLWRIVEKWEQSEHSTNFLQFLTQLQLVHWQCIILAKLIYWSSENSNSPAGRWGTQRQQQSAHSSSAAATTNTILKSINMSAPLHRLDPSRDHN